MGLEQRMMEQQHLPLRQSQYQPSPDVIILDAKPASTRDSSTQMGYEKPKETTVLSKEEL